MSNINLGSRPLLGQYQCIATRAYFHKNAGYGKQKKVFIISGDFVQITNISQDNSFGYAVYIGVSGKQTEGWLKLSDLSRVE